MVFEWDDVKAEDNKKKHGVSFAEAATAFSDPNSIELIDVDSSDKEERWILVGLSTKTRVLLVIYAEHDHERIRIISARKANKDETDQYFSRVKT